VVNGRYDMVRRTRRALVSAGVEQLSEKFP